jgi:hypothetical protein
MSTNPFAESDRLRHMLHQDLVQHALVPCCLHCDRFDEKTEKCSLYNARPPARVIALSCGKEWMMLIPF